MDVADMTLQVLKDIREEQRATREEVRGMGGEIRAMREEMRATNELHAQRFEVIGTAIRDMSEQLVMLARGIRVALDSRAVQDVRVDEHERRITALEQRMS